MRWFCGWILWDASQHHRSEWHELDCAVARGLAYHGDAFALSSVPELDLDTA